MRLLRPTLLAALALAAAPGLRAEQITLLADQDTSLYSESGELSNGLGEHVFAGKTAMGFLRRALLRFDLAGLPAGSTVNSVELRLRLSQEPTNQGQPLAVHRVTEAWGEGGSDAIGSEGMGTQATAGDATWTWRVWPSSAWATPGGSFDATVSGQTIVTFGSPTAFFSWTDPGLAADVQAWLDGTQPNHGWLLKHADELADKTARRFDSRQNLTGIARPALIVDYTPGGPTGTPFCAGSAQACPCGNGGAASRGCDNSFATGGARLAATGAASVSADTVLLSADGLPPTAPALFFQGTAQVSGGFGSAFGDGLRCVTGSVQRLGSKIASGGSASYPVAGDASVSQKGQVPGSGGVRYYQTWYRNNAPFCTPDGFNLSNGVEILWGL